MPAAAHESSSSTLATAQQAARVTRIKDARSQVRMTAQYAENSGVTVKIWSAKPYGE